MAKQSSQKFIARNRAPRVQIEYDVELYGAEKKVQLPFVMGVMADLAGNVAWKCPWCQSSRGMGHTEDCAREVALEAADEPA